LDSQKEDSAVCWDFAQQFEDPLSNPLFLEEVFSAEPRVVFWRRNVCCEQRIDGNSSQLEATKSINQGDYSNKKVQSFSPSVTPCTRT